MTYYYTKLTYLDGIEEYHYINSEDYWNITRQFANSNAYHIDFYPRVGESKGYRVFVLKSLLRSFAGKLLSEEEGRNLEGNSNESRASGENQNV